MLPVLACDCNVTTAGLPGLAPPPPSVVWLHGQGEREDPGGGAPRIRSARGCQPRPPGAQRQRAPCCSGCSGALQPLGGGHQRDVQDAGERGVFKFGLSVHGSVHVCWLFTPQWEEAVADGTVWLEACRFLRPLWALLLQPKRQDWNLPSCAGSQQVPNAIAAHTHPSRRAPACCPCSSSACWRTCS